MDMRGHIGKLHFQNDLQLQARMAEKSRIVECEKSLDVEMPRIEKQVYFRWPLQRLITSSCAGEGGKSGQLPIAVLSREGRQVN